jgi:hypothetical protein
LTAETVFFSRYFVQGSEELFSVEPLTPHGGYLAGGRPLVGSIAGSSRGAEVSRPSRVSAVARARAIMMLEDTDTVDGKELVFSPLYVLIVCVTWIQGFII